ncbi:hypothetical protein EJB05_25663, partial [Eragrostis curvula]
MLDQDMAILCHGDGGEFTVADLTCRSPREVELCVLHHRPTTSNGNGIVTMQWRVHKLPTPPDMKINPSLWTTDAIFPLDGCLCWVDYYQGLLLVDVLLANNDSDTDQQQKQLRYIPLPRQALRSRRYYIDADSPDPFRHVSVTDAGIVKLVCIFTKDASSSNFTIITWSFDIRNGNWTKDCGNTVEGVEFFGMLDAARSRMLPRVRPSFPVVTLADPDVVCFMLEEVLEDHCVYCMIEVNMRNKKLQSSAPYMREEEEEGYYPGKPRRKFYGHYFIPSNFLLYLSQDGCTRTANKFVMQGNVSGVQRPPTRISNRSAHGLDLLLDAVCFMLEEVLEDQSDYWMIEVNMRNKKLPYMREEDEEGSYPGKPRKNFYGHYFILVHASLCTTTCSLSITGMATATAENANSLLLLLSLSPMSRVIIKGKKRAPPDGAFQCRTCGRRFATFQALGGHRTSHKRPRVRADGLDLLLGARPGAKGGGAAKDVHRCNTCGTVFPTGQALGGHMRRHRATIFHLPALETMTVGSSEELDGEDDEGHLRSSLIQFI